MSKYLTTEEPENINNVWDIKTVQKMALNAPVKNVMITNAVKMNVPYVLNVTNTGLTALQDVSNH